MAGYVVRDPARVPSSWRSRRSLDDELRAQGVVGISGIDTRALTRHLRERGAMRVGHLLDRDRRRTRCSDGCAARRRWPAPSWPGRSPRRRLTSCRRARGEAAHRRRPRPRHQGDDAPPDGRAGHRGARAAGHGDDRRPPGHRRRRAVLLQRPRRPGGDTSQVELLQARAGRRASPTSGSASATSCSAGRSGFGTFKLKYGHRGINQPVMDRTTGKVEVTAHNHGFAVDAPLDGATETPYGVATVSHVCLNDDVVEGLELRDAEGRLKASRSSTTPKPRPEPTTRRTSSTGSSGSWTGLSDAEARRHQVRAGDRLG